MFVKRNLSPSAYKSIGESKAVFLRGVGGDAATEPRRTGFGGIRKGISKRNFGTHKDLNAATLKPDARTSSLEAHVGEGGRSTVRIRGVRLVGRAGREQQEGAATAGRDSQESCQRRTDPRWLPECASESRSAGRRVRIPMVSCCWMEHLYGRAREEKRYPDLHCTLAGSHGVSCAGRRRRLFQNCTPRWKNADQSACDSFLAITGVASGGNSHGPSTTGEPGVDCRHMSCGRMA